MVTKENIQDMAILSKLHIEESELKNITEDMQQIIDFAKEINEFSKPGEEFDNINNLSNVFRKDEVVKSYDVEEILKNAPDVADNQFLVKRKA